MTHNAKLTWQDGQPYSEAFGDVYFSRDCGLEETWHVFLRHNQLPERFSALAPYQGFTIAETGFGTGLNFLCAWQCFNQYAPAGTQLHFISVEKFPLSPADLSQALSLWPALSGLAQQLCTEYRILPCGWHRFLFDGGRVTLTLIIGDALDMLSTLDAKVDAWFLDGFAPSKNPDMWSDALFSTMAHLSAPQASFSTFTSAGIVRRGLQAAGFLVEKVQGFGSKREMSCGTLAPRVQAAPWQAPWFARPMPPAPEQKSAIVIGGGIAGASSAYSLAVRGWQVTLIERHDHLAAEASGNPQGILYARLSAHPTPLTQLVLAGYCHTLGLLHRLLPQSDETWRACGLLQLASDSLEHERQLALIESGIAGELACMLSTEEASARAGIALPQGGLFFPQGGWLNPPALVAALCAHPGIQVKTDAAVLELDYSEEYQHWIAMNHQGPVALGSVVILAGGVDSLNFDCTQHLPLKRIRGQISNLPATAQSQALQTVICSEGYIAPASKGLHAIGASFKFNVDHLKLSAEEHQENLAALARSVPSLHQALQADTLDTSALDGRAAFRCSSPDYFPLVGPVAVPESFIQRYYDLTRDASLRIRAPSPWVPGLYVNTAHGSRGMVSAPLSGEVLAAYLNNEPSPLSKPLLDVLHPSRFLLRDLIRGKFDD